MPASVPASGKKTPVAGSTKRWTRPPSPSRHATRIAGTRSVGNNTLQNGELAATAASTVGCNASIETFVSAGKGRRVIGAIQRSISRSNTASVPIQKMASSTPPRTTPAQVCSQFIEPRNVGSMKDQLFGCARCDSARDVAAAAPRAMRTRYREGPIGIKRRQEQGGTRRRLRCPQRRSCATTATSEIAVSGGWKIRGVPISRSLDAPGTSARAAGLALRGQPDLLAARALGVSRPRIALRHVLPAILPVVLALTGVHFSSAVLAEATLSFVGLTNHDVPGWGHIMAHAGPYLRDAWWMWLFPGALLIMATAGVTLLADA